ncbi:TWiK family of potassium channels protein 7-like [Cylas formicarius]|uniref:TWiK family of potassium channels protein 7-like n=1 Tax=Cylas formicarius TaxID=197179 RepID=UPI002958AA36|nr:TWiK family of potassium channels protein 7-like [Cylas formicarius]
MNSKPNFQRQTSQKSYAKKSPTIWDEYPPLTSSKRESYGRRASQFIAGHIKSYKVYRKIARLSRKWFTHIFLCVVLLLYTAGGAIAFLTVEGRNESKLIKQEIRLEIRELLRQLRLKAHVIPARYSAEEWVGEASRVIMRFEERMTDAYDKHPLVVSSPNQEVWTIWNSIVYCATLYTTIGYGHLYPTTFTGRVLTIAYSIIGIPLFLIVLADFGKLFTKAIKWVWSRLRRLCQTGGCLRARKTAHIQEILKGAQMMYQIATFRRNSKAPLGEEQEADEENPKGLEFQTSVEVDENFDLPVTLALFILVTYIFCGAIIYMYWEEWDFFSSFYFVFISMSTVGFGDYVPQQPICMIASIIYLCFGLALMSMCINVVQDKLSDTFQHASAKISTGLGIDETPTSENGGDGDTPKVHTAVIVDG